MLHDFLYTPFSDPGPRQLYEQLRAALQADSATGTTLLLGNFAVEDEGEALDAVIVRPHSITVLGLVPRGGQLQVPALGYGAGQLAGAPLHGSNGADNPYEQFRRQKAALAGWLGGQFAPEQANLQFISGLAVFAAPVTFGPGVEAQLSQQPDGSFQLLGSLDQLPRRLAQLARPEINLSEADLTEWVRTLAEDPEPDAGTTAEASFPPEPEAAPFAERSFLRRAWGWLGAEDIPEDVPYGGQPAAQAAASAAEKQRLERMQREAQAQVQQQLQAMEAREAEREHSIRELRAQLAQAPPVTTEAQALQARLAAESQEKAALEAAIRASRAESETRNRELDTKIAQLGQLIEQLNTRTAAAGTFQAAPATRGTKRPARGRSRLTRAAAVAGVVALLGAGAWGMSRLGNDPSPSTAANAPVTGSQSASAEDANSAPIESAPTASAPAAEQPQPAATDEASETAPESAAASAKPDIYEARYPYADGYARVKLNGAYTFIDKAEKQFDRTFLEAWDFSEGHAAVRDQRGWQYITGPEAEDPNTPPFLFQEAYSFRDGLARVRLKPGYTYITKRNLAGLGPSVFQVYEAATDFKDGRAQVTREGSRFTIDQNGQTVK